MKNIIFFLTTLKQSLYMTYKYYESKNTTEIYPHHIHQYSTLDMSYLQSLSLAVYWENHFLGIYASLPNTKWLFFGNILCWWYWCIVRKFEFWIYFIVVADVMIIVCWVAMLQKISKDFSDVLNHTCEIFMVIYSLHTMWKINLYHKLLFSIHWWHWYNSITIYATHLFISIHLSQKWIDFLDDNMNSINVKQLPYLECFDNWKYLPFRALIIAGNTVQFDHFHDNAEKLDFLDHLSLIRNAVSNINNLHINGIIEIHKVMGEWNDSSWHLHCIQWCVEKRDK